MGLLKFSNIEGVQNMRCCGGVTRNELDSTRDEPPHSIKGCIPHNRLRGGGIDGYRWEWETPCTGKQSINCCKDGGDCKSSRDGGYCNVPDGKDYKYCAGEIINGEVVDGDIPIEMRDGSGNARDLKCNQSEKESLTLFCPGIELDNLKSDCYNSSGGGKKCPTIDSMYKNIMRITKGDINKDRTVNQKLNIIKRYHQQIYSNAVLDKNDPLYGLIPLSYDCKTNNNEVCHRGKYYYDNMCSYNGRMADPNIYNLEWIYTVLIIIVVFIILIILILIFKDKRDQSTNIDESKGIGELAKDIKDM